jgi:membrane associated rhomboid family serine protease
MIPIRDTTPTKNFPVVNLTLIAVNAAIFLVQILQGPGLERFIYFYGLVPARYSVPQISSYFSPGQQLSSFISFMFLHGSFWHLLGNMWSLYIFGDNVEDRLGHLRYVLFYLLCGIASGISHLLLNINSNIPTIGASGAIAGVMGAYFILHPFSKILTLIPILFIPWFIEIPAFFFLGFWFILQFISAAGAHGDVSGIAWWAHIGGFIFGIIILKLFLLLPATGFTEKVRSVTAKKKTHRLQVIRPIGTSNDPHLYGSIQVTPFEAASGTNKLVNIPWGFHKRLIRVIVPPGIGDEKMLRLKGLGKQISDNQAGDLFLKVLIRPQQD